jgi:hypothetical protein
MAMLPGITAVIAFGSGAFLAVYTLVNYLQARMATRRVDRVLAWTGASACVAALGALVVELARDDLVALVVLSALGGALALGRIAFVRRVSRPR